MKLYRDVFGNLLSKQDVTAATRLIVQTGKVSPSMLQRSFKWGYGKAARIVALLGDANVVSPASSKPRSVILNNEDMAVNAALRQLKKGKKS